MSMREEAGGGTAVGFPDPEVSTENKTKGG